MSALPTQRLVRFAPLASLVLALTGGLVTFADEGTESQPSGGEGIVIRNLLVGGEERASAESSYWIGIGCVPVGAELRAKLKLDEGQGLVVNVVFPKSPAALAELRQNDVILQAGKAPVGKVEQLAKSVADSGGAALLLKILRDGQEKTISVTPAKRAGAGRIIVIGEDDDDDRGDGKDNDKRMPHKDGDAAQAKEVERLQAIQNELREQLTRLRDEPGRRGIIYRPQPGQPGAMQIGAAANPILPDDMQVTIQKRGSKPARVIAVQGEKTWQTTENELDMLPVVARIFAARALGKPGLAAGSTVGSAGMPMQRFDVQLTEDGQVQVRGKQSNPGVVVNRVPGGVQIQIVEDQDQPQPQRLEPALKPAVQWQELKRPAPDSNRQLQELREQSEQLLHEVKEFQERRRETPNKVEKTSDSAPAVGAPTAWTTTQSFAALYIENTGKIVDLTDDQKLAITKIFEARERSSKDFEAKNAEQIKAVSDALVAAFKNSDKDAINNATKVRQELYAPVQEAWKKSQTDLMNVLTAEQRNKVREHQLTSSVGTMITPITLTEEQWKRIRVASQEGQELGWEKFPQVLQEVLTTEQKSAIAKYRLMDAAKMNFRGASLTDDQLHAVEATCDELVPGYSKLGLDPELWRKVTDKVNGLLTDEQKEGLKKARSVWIQPRSAGGASRADEAVEKE